MINPVLNTPPAQGAKQNNTQTADGFGAVLARQMDVKDDKTPVSGKEVKKSDKPEKEQVNQDAAPQVVIDALINPLAALLLGAQIPNAASTPETPSTPETSGKAPPDAGSTALLLPGNPEVRLAPDVRVSSTDNSTGIATVNPAVHTAAPGLTKVELTAPAKTEPAIAAAPVVAATPVFGLDDIKTAEAMPAPPAQVMIQSAASQIAPNPVSAPPANIKIAAPLGSRAWPDEFSQKISWVSTQQNQVAELHLNPPDLGPMSVVLSISDNQATALFTSPHSAVRDAIENAMPKLRESLAENGIMLGNATVSDQPSRDSNSSGFMNQRRETPGITETEKSPPITIPVRRHLGVVDTFA